MKLILSTAYIPPIEYFVWILRAEVLYIEQCENYHKQSYRNRTSIYASDGKMDLSIPINKITGNHTLISDIKISYLDNWNKKHWKAIESAYNKSPYFLYYMDELSEFYTKKSEYLFKYNVELLQFFLKKLRIKTKIEYTNDYLSNYGEDIIDLRETIHPKIQSKLNFPSYMQVFEHKLGFLPNLSIIDLLFNLGPDAVSYLQKINVVDIN